MSDKYTPMDIDNNVRVAVKELREAYGSNDTERYAKQFVLAKEIIISSICNHGYTVVKEGDKEEERPHGEWGKRTYGYLSTHDCSNCGFNGNQLWHFCPNCGASMRKEGEAE